jgi:DNA-binding transcriptional MerR regulator
MTIINDAGFDFDTNIEPPRLTSPASDPVEGRARLTGKSVSAFRTISEVSLDLDVPQHVLRFWESKFTQLRPLKRGGGRRYYRPEDVDLIRRIHSLLYREGYTIKGVQRLLKSPNRAANEDNSPIDSPEPELVPISANPSASSDILLRELLSELKLLRGLLV